MLAGPRGTGDPVEAIALVSGQGFNVRYDIDRTTGTFCRPEHDLYGQTCVGRILIFGGAKGGIATSWALADLKARGLAPAGLVFRRANPVVVQGAVHAGIPILHSLTPEPGEALRSGDRVRLEPALGQLHRLPRGTQSDE